MSEKIVETEINSPKFTEEKAAIIKESRDSQQWLKVEVKNVFWKLDFHYDTSATSGDWENIINWLSQKFNNDSSVEWILFNNPQVKKLLSNIVKSQANDIKKDKDIYQKYLLTKKDEVKQDSNKSEGLDGNEIIDDTIESWEDYKYKHTSIENFENYILSDEWVAVIIKEIKRHIDMKTGKVYTNYPISEDILKLKLKNAWDNSLRKKYNKNRDETNEEKDKFDKLWNLFEGKIDNIVWEYIKNWWNKFNQSLINNLNNLIFQKWDSESLFELLKISDYNDMFKGLLRDKIKNFSSLVFDSKHFSLNTWDTQIDLQLRSYLFIYGKLFYPGLFKDNQWIPYYENLFPKIMSAILVADGDTELKNIIKNNKFLEQEIKLVNQRKKKDKERREMIARINMRYKHRWFDWWSRNRRTMHSSLWTIWNLQNASWMQVAKTSNLNLSDFKIHWMNSEDFVKNWLIKRRAFWIAWNKFLKTNEKMKEIITLENMHHLYNENTNTIDKSEREKFLKSDIMKWRSQKEIDYIYAVLSTFPSEFNNTLEYVVSHAVKMEWKAGDTIRNYAIWSVIDNVRYIFADIVEKWKWNSKFKWFIFNESEPVKREWNDIIISGTFNWSAIKIRYNLISWWLYMNSFLQHPSNSKIVIGNDDNANLKIWQLESFDTILEEHYRTPDISLESKYHTKTRWNKYSSHQHSSHHNSSLNSNKQLEEYKIDNNNPLTSQNLVENQVMDEQQNLPNHVENTLSNVSEPDFMRPMHFKNNIWYKWEIDEIRKKYKEMLYSNLDMISDRIIDNTKKQSAINSVLIKFMKTFNIIWDWWNESIEFNEWSNLFDFVQIIENSDSDTINKFQLFMERVLNPELSWIQWWTNNPFGSKKRFDKTNKNKYMSLVIDNIQSFSYEPNKFKNNGVQSFGLDHQLWFAQMIIDNIVENKKPNWKLDSLKIDSFIKHFETGDNNSK